MRGPLDGWTGRSRPGYSDAIVSPTLHPVGLTEWYESAFNAVEFVTLGVVQIAVIGLVLRVIPAPLAPWKRAMTG